MYLDTCCYQRPAELRGGATEPRVRREAEEITAILAACRTGAAARIASPILWYKVGLITDDDLRAEVGRFLAGPDHDAPLDRAGGEAAATFARGRTGRRRGRDCDELHLAAAVAAGAAVLCTVDDKFLAWARRAETGGTRILRPAELLILLREDAP